MAKFADIRVMARGWNHEAWVEQGFYPDDLPEDWRLPFYSNEFRAVLIPTEDWRSVTDEMLEEWLDEVPDEFQFFLELADVFGDAAAVGAVAAQLGPHLGGFVCCPQTVPEDLDAWLSQLKPLYDLGPVGMLLPPATRLDGAQGLNPCWRLAEDVSPWFEGDTCFAWVDGDMTYSPRQWREKMDRLRDAAKGHTVALIFDGLPPDVEAMRVVSAIGDMLGPAKECAD
jgi:hypothetical protein